MNRTRLVRNSKLGNIVLISFAFLSHILMGVFVYLCKGYYNLSKSTMISLLGVAIAVLILADILCVIWFNHRDKLAKIISIILITIVTLVASAGVVVLFKLNSDVNKVIDNGGSEQYEMVYVSYVSYDTTYDSIEKISGKKVGYIQSSEAGVGSLGMEYLEEEGISVNYQMYSSQDDLFFALIAGDVDAAILPSAYQQKYVNDTNIDYSEHLEKCNLIYSFEKKIKTGENENVDKDLTIEPFNILLIGYAPENDSYGLSDTIILASVNPQTLTVGLTSIARDSYVPIACYGNQSSDKINAARGVSRQCLMDTVSNLLDVDVELYVEVNFKGLVSIVDAVGGIPIYSEEDFVGQTSSTERGEYFIEIPAGWYWANGEEALSFARERHAFSDGDFARQRHQKQVILAIAEQILEVRSINTVLSVMEAAGNNFSTNLSLDQITNLFNYLMSVDTNPTGLTIMDLINIVDMRITGYSSWHYNTQVHLPLWIYKLYQGSIDETKENVANILSGTAFKEPNENYAYYYDWPYYLPKYYSTVFDETQVHEEMPAYYPNLTGMTYEEIMTWASKNGATVNVEELSTDGYPESQWGKIVKQSVSYGQLVADYPSVTITVIGPIGPKMPNFVDEYIETATEWAKENSYTVSAEVITVDSKDYNALKAGKIVSQTPKANSSIKEGGTLSIKYYDYFTIDATKTFVNSTETNTLANAKIWINKYMKFPDTVVYKPVVTDDTSLSSSNRIVSAVFANGNVTALNNSKTLVISYYVKAENFDIKIETSGQGTVTGAGSHSNAVPATVTATPNDGYKFAGWYEGSNLVSSDSTYTFNVERNITLTAKFVEKNKVKVSVSAGTGGTAEANKTEVYEGDAVTLTANANSGYRFKQWSDGNASSTRTINPTADCTYTAEFVKEYTITVNNGSGSGTYVENQKVQISASTPEGQTFVQWNDGNTNSSREITVTGDATYTAEFTSAE